MNRASRRLSRYVPRFVGGSRHGHYGQLFLAIVLAGALASAAPAAAYQGTATSHGSSVAKSSSGEESILYGLSCTSGASCMTVGSFGGGVIDEGTLAERWDGSTWSVLSTPNQGNESVLAGVSCTSSSACTAVGSAPGGVTLAEGWDGSSWSIETTPNAGGGAGLSGVSCPASGFCMAVGTASGLPMSEIWNGSSWSIESVPAPGGTGASSLRKVSCVSETWCVAVGTGGGTLAEYWDGSTWTIQSTPNPENGNDAYLNDVSCGSDSSCVAVGPGFFGNMGRSTWTLEDTAEPAGGTGGGLAAVSCLPSVTPASCTGVGGYADSMGTDVTLSETWNGSTWTIQSTPNPARNHRSYLSGVSCLDASSCTAVGIHETTAESGARGWSSPGTGAVGQSTKPRPSYL